MAEDPRPGEDAPPNPERRGFEHAQRESERRQRMILDSLHEHVIYTDCDLRIQWANLAACESVGLSREEIIGRRCHELWGESETPCDDCPVVRARQLGELSQIEKRTPDGRVWRIRGYPARDEADAIIGGIETTLEVTREVSAERERAAATRHLRAVFESSPLGIMIIGEGARIVDANPAAAAMLGYGHDELVGKTVMDITHPEDLPWSNARILEMMKDPAQEHVRMELRLLRKDGSAIWVNNVGTMMRDEDGNPINSLSIYEDVTERRRAEEERRRLEAQVQHAQKLESLGVLAGGIAHDFNNLLMSMLGNADLAMSDLPPTSPARDRIADIETAARRAADLCRQMLAYSGKGRFVVEALDLQRVVDEMSRMLEVSVSKRAVLKVNHADDLPTIRGDATQIRQVIMNLITNASEALAERSGVVSISTGAMSCDREYLRETYLDEALPEGAYVYLEVADTGCGMEEETRRRMFEPFFTTKFTGRGLGMAAVLGIVRGHGGAIKVYSEPRKGTTVKVLFPASVQPPAAEGPAAPAADLKAVGTVLLVDDEESVRTVATRMLERLGFDVLTAADGLEALETYRENQDRVSCVLLDLTMPHLDGEEAFRELRRIRNDLRVILSSGYNEQDVVQRFAGKGLTGFIQKPYQLGKLREVLQGVFGSDDAS